MSGKNKTGQVMGQVLVYIFAGFIFITVLIYGYNAIGKFNEQRDYVAMVELRTKITSTVNSLASSRSLERVTITVPSGTQKICFVDTRKNPIVPSHFEPPGIPGLCDVDHGDYDPRMCWSWKDNVSKNIYFWPSINLQISVGDIKLVDQDGNDKGYICQNITREVIYLELEGLGDATSIKRWIPMG